MVFCYSSPNLLRHPPFTPSPTLRSPRCSWNDPLKYKVEHATHAQKSLVLSHLTQPQFPHPQHYGLCYYTLLMGIYSLCLLHSPPASLLYQFIYYVYWLLSGSFSKNFKLQDDRDLYVVSLLKAVPPGPRKMPGIQN